MFEQPKTSSEKVIEQQFLLAEMAIDAENYARAFTVYQTINDLADAPKAKYQLGMLSALGKGTKQNYLQAATYFMQAHNQLHDKDTHTMFLKSTLDYFKEDFATTDAKALWDKGLAFAQAVFPGKDQRAISCEYLTKLLDFYGDKNDFDACFKILKAMSMYGNDPRGQNLLAVFYNQGVSVERNDLLALYWFDKAGKQGHVESKKDAQGILYAYRDSLSRAEFSAHMGMIRTWCAQGTQDIPQDADGEAYWRSMKYPFW